MRAKSFFYVSLGILALAAAYHLGAQSAAAQVPGNPVVAGWQAYISGTGASNAVVTANGDVYTSGNGVGWGLIGNVFGGGPIPARQDSWGGLKARYRGDRGAASNTPTDR